MIPYGRQEVSKEDIAAVVEVLQSDFLTQGPVVPAFEEYLARYCDARHAVAANSATSSLHLACLALGVGAGDLVWTSAITFVASSNCALYCGAAVDFVDIDPQTCNMSVICLEAKLRQAALSGRLPKVVIPVHLCGQACDMQAIGLLAEEYGFRVIEDASHAVGGRYRNERIGNCRYSDITVFSFHPVKIVTSAEGGMALTNDAGIAEKMRLLRSHGITRDEALMTKSPDGPWYYEQIELGFNYRMTDLQAALGLSQMKRIDDFVETRHRLASRYVSLMADLAVTPLLQERDTYSALHLFVIRLKKNLIRITHREVFQQMRSRGIGVNLHYMPVYLQPYYKKLGFQAGYCPEAEQYYAEAISLPLYTTLSDDQQDVVVDALRQILA